MQKHGVVSSSAVLDDWLNAKQQQSNNRKPHQSSASINRQQQSSSSSVANKEKKNNNNNNKNTIRIFVSSTFSDMTRERDLIATRVAPRVTKFGESIGVTVAISDLRWGITADQSQDTVAVCLDEVQKSDIVLVFCGQRYGWHVCSSSSSQQQQQQLQQTSNMKTKNQAETVPINEKDKNEALLKSIKQACEMFASSTLPWLKQMNLLPSSSSSSNTTGNDSSSLASFLRKSSVTELEVRTALLKENTDLRNIHVFLRMNSTNNNSSTKEIVSTEQQQYDGNCCLEARNRLDAMKNALSTLPSAKRYKALGGTSSSSSSKKDDKNHNSDNIIQEQDRTFSALPTLKSSLELEESIVSSICESILNVFPERRNLGKPRKWERESQIQEVLANRSQIGFCAEF